MKLVQLCTILAMAGIIFGIPAGVVWIGSALGDNELKSRCLEKNYGYFKNDYRSECARVGVDVTDDPDYIQARHAEENKRIEQLRKEILLENEVRKLCKADQKYYVKNFDSCYDLVNGWNSRPRYVAPDGQVYAEGTQYDLDRRHYKQ